MNAIDSSSNAPIRPIKSSNAMPFMIGGAIIVILVGLGVGFFVSSKRTSSLPKPKVNGNSVVVSADEAGVSDVTNYKDNATGTLQKGGIKGEGTFHIDREGGPEHTVYLNSTTVDMNPFVGKKVQVWGQTQAAQFAPWLMDVVKIKTVQ